MSKIFFISYSSVTSLLDDSVRARQKLLNKSAVTVANADEEISWTKNDIKESNFFLRNQKILQQERGAGYWIWKPYIILKTLNKVAKNDWVIYSDVGKPFRRNDPNRCGNNKIGNVMNVSFDALIDFADQQSGFTPGTWVPHYGNAKKWTKRDCFVGMGCDYPEYHNSGQLIASYSCWSNTEASRKFLTQWLNWCQMEAIVTDATNVYGKPNFAEFSDHRHDQSICTNLTIKNKIKLFNSPKKSLNGFRDFNFTIRHMALAKLLASKVNSLEILFQKKQLFPTYLKQALQLWLLPELKPDCKINILNDADLNLWQQAFPDAKTSSFQYPLNDTPINEQYTAVFANDCSNIDHLPTLLANSYDSLLPGGVLFLGPFKGTESPQAKLNSSFDDLLQWIFINQCFPPGLSTKKNQLPNAITLGNTHNPFVVSPAIGERYVILRKPHMNLSTL